MLSAESAATAATERIVVVGCEYNVVDWLGGRLLVVVVDSPNLLKCMLVVLCVEYEWNANVCVSEEDKNTKYQRTSRSKQNHSKESEGS